MKPLIAIVEAFTAGGTIRAAVPLLAALCLIAPIGLASDSALFATIAAMQIALMTGIAAGRLASGAVSQRLRAGRQ
nr:hypothetical protein [uncultured Rhodopila sp.]